MTSGSLKPPFPESADPQMSRHAWLAGRRVLVAARLGWLVVTALSLVLLYIDVPALYRSWKTLEQYQYPSHERILANLGQLHLHVSVYAAYLLMLDLILAIACFAVGSIIGLRRSHQPMALYVAWLLVTLGSASLDPIAVLGHPGVIGKPPGALYSLNLLINWISFESVVLLLLLFPDCRFRPRWSRWLAPLPLIWWLVPISNPWFALLNLSFVAAVLAISVNAQRYRYDHLSNAVQRQQSRLVAVGFAIAGCAFIFDRLFVEFLTRFSLFQPGTLAYMVESAVTTIGLLCIPAAFGIAMMRYHLWDIDLIINRTLVYVLLTALLTGLFAGLTKIFQDLFDQYTGAGSVGAVLSIIVVVAAFTPLKNGVQTVVDRHLKLTPRLAAAAGAALAIAGAPAVPSVAQDARIEELRGEIAELRAELATHEAAEQELHQPHTMVEQQAAPGSAPHPESTSSTPAPGGANTSAHDSAE